MARYSVNMVDVFSTNTFIPSEGEFIYRNR